MDAFLVFYIVLTFIATALTAMLAIYAWRHRQAAGATGFTVLMSFITEWSLVSGFQILSPNESVWMFLTNLKYLALAGAPVALLVFALQYTGQRLWLRRRYVIAYSIIPAITQLMVWTDLWNLWGVPVEQRGLWFWVHTAYSFTLVFMGLILMSLAIVRASTMRKWQAAAVVFGISLPVIVNVLLTFGIIPYVVDWTPLAFTITGLVFAWALYRHRLFDLTPLAREALIDGMQDAVIVLDAQYRLVDFNPAARTMFAVTAVSTAHTLAANFPAWRQALPLLAQEQASEMECVLTLNAKPRDYAVYITPLYDKNAVLAGYLLRWHDITARKQAEIAIHEYAQELEQHNAELDAFAHTVAHDLKTPLSVLVGFSTLLESRLVTMPQDKVYENLHRVTQTGQKMSNIIDELLLLSNVRKVEAVNVQPLAMERILGEAQKRLQPLLETHQATLRLPETWPTALGYAPWVEEIWVNYISNALKYGGTPPRVELGATVEETQIFFWCRDNGQGLTEAECASLFAPFTRLHEVRAEGHGLGLSIVRRIVEKLNGEVGVESTPDLGSTFWFSLPKS